MGFLITVLPIALATWFALSPPRSPKALRRVGLRMGLLVNELPFIVVLWLLVATAMAVADGDASSAGGAAVLGLALLTVAGIAVVVWRASKTKAGVERALQEGLGRGWRKALPRATAGRLEQRPPVGRIVLAPFYVRRRDVRRDANIAYGDAGRRNRLDVYRHRSRPTGCPVLVYFHGGGYFSGRKNREARPLLYRLASQGWVCISANYRLRPSAAFPAHLIDAKKALAWAREQGHRYGGDPDQLFVAGSSAGGHLAALAALTNDPTFQPGFEEADTSVAAAVCLYGYYGNYYGQGPATSPVTYVRPDAPPFFLAHGDRDSEVSVKGARRFASALRSASAAPVVYAELQGAQHAFDLFHSLRFARVVDAVEGFLEWVRSARCPETGTLETGLAHRTDRAEGAGPSLYGAGW